MPALDRFRSVLRLTRLSGAFGAVACVWFVVLWTHAVEDGALTRVDLAADLAGATLLAVGLYSFAAALNDLIDLRRDRLLGRERPLAQGEISAEVGLLVVTFSLLGGLAGAVTLGLASVVVALSVAGAIALFNAAFKLIPAARLTLVATVYAAHMVVPNVELEFLWPVWLAMTHAMVTAGLAAWVSRRTPRLSVRAAVFALVGWVAASGVLARLALVRTGSIWPGFVPLSIVWPVVIAGIALVVYVVWRAGDDRARAAERIERYGALWQAVYATAWLVGQGERRAALVMGAFAAVGFVATGVLREAYAIADQPIRYRR